MFGDLKRRFNQGRDGFLLCEDVLRLFSGVYRGMNNEG